MKKIEIDTPFGVWEIVEVEEYVLKITHLKSGDSFTLESNPNFPPCSASSLTAFAKVHNHKFPTITQLEILRALFGSGLREWFVYSNVSFSYPLTTIISNEILSATMKNPYGEDIVFNRYVCYNLYSDEIKVIEGEQKVKYMLLK
jgi:hypothetical protein